MVDGVTLPGSHATSRRQVEQSGEPRGTSRTQLAGDSNGCRGRTQFRGSCSRDRAQTVSTVGVSGPLLSSSSPAVLRGGGAHGRAVYSPVCTIVSPLLRGKRWTVPRLNIYARMRAIFLNSPKDRS
ncbi:hypothetical protein J6590_081496 [Homalodisca vitripennis]|nr:hypothetical protein J6590_081496 [Homalodisca vitripennis]